MVLLRAVFSPVLVLVTVAACDVGEVPIGGGGHGGGSGSGSAGFATTCVDRSASPGVSHDHGGGVTHAGQGCIGVGCHLLGQAGGEFTAAGTVYKADGVTPNPGAVVRIKSGTMTLTAIAESAGTFHFSQPITFPTITDVSACPDASKMTGKIQAGGGGNCSSGTSCHATGGSPGPIKGLP